MDDPAGEELIGKVKPMKKTDTLFLLLLICGFSFSVFAEDIAGTVLLPNGQPAAGAQVALAFPGDTLDLSHAKMQKYAGIANLVILADRDGRFSFPANEKDWAIVAMNEAGCTQVEKKDFETGSKIMLQPWARIEGVLHVGTRVGTNEQMVLGSVPGARFFFELQSFQDWTDRDGKFVFNCVPAGTWNISHGGEPFWNGEKVTVKAGETNRVTIGGTGRPVIGRLQIPTTVTNAPARMTVARGGWMFVYPDSTTKRTSHAISITLYTTNRELTAQMSLDGTFRVEDITPGTWHLLMNILNVPKDGGDDKTMATAGRIFVVPEMPDGRSDEPLDLGTIEPVLVHSPQVGEAAPTFEVKTVDDKTFKLADHRGQYVLLDFEPMNWRGQTNQSIQATWNAFGKNDRLAMLTLSVPPTTSDFGGADTEYLWPQARLREVPWYEVMSLRASYGLQCDRSIEADTNLPAIFLVNPDGTIIAKDLHGDAIKAAVTKALEKR